MSILQKGKYGSALNLSHDMDYWVAAGFNREYMCFPLTVECWVKLRSSHSINVILTDGYYVSGYGLVSNQWCIYSVSGTGEFAVMLPNMEPSETKPSSDAASSSNGGSANGNVQKANFMEGLTKTAEFLPEYEINSGHSITDNQWHYIAMVVTYDEVKLCLDGDIVAEVKIKPRVPVLSSNFPGLENVGRTDEGPLFFGCFPPSALTCDGLISEVRLSRQVRVVESIPSQPMVADLTTIGLWQFESLDDQGHFVDLSRTNNQARVEQQEKTLDENDRKAFGISTDPFDRDMSFSDCDVITDENAITGRVQGSEEVALNGKWECVGVAPHGVSPNAMVLDDARWGDSFPAEVPCTIHTALLDNGLIDDPMILYNDIHVTWVADREWWLRRTFTIPENWKGTNISLCFDGVDYRATFWLNGHRLGQHDGMFGGPDFDVSSVLKYGDQENTLIVCIDPANPTWEGTLKNNNAYGWHYVKLVTQGIWRPVHLRMRRGTKMDHPFLRTREIREDGVGVDLSLDCWHWGDEESSLDLEVRLTPKNFDGASYMFTREIKVETGYNELGFSTDLKGCELWWPVDMGEPNLYWFECTLSSGGQVIDRFRSHWGARTVEMVPNSDGPKPQQYNWQFVINGQPIWIKGTNWCFTDSLLRYDRQRNERTIQLARNAHIQLFRVWGGGPIENDEFYDLCDELGVLVQQEFSILGFHHLENIPSNLATDTTWYMVKRLRNRPSLAVWASANEISGQGRIVEVLGRRCLELDGTRPYHRSCPYAGDGHWHSVYWGKRPLLDYRKAADGRLRTWAPYYVPESGPTAVTEFGLSSPANYETWKRIIPSDEWNDWPPKPESNFVHHTPTYHYNNVDLMTQYASDFLDPHNLRELIKGMQVAQGLGMKMLIESMRARKPQSTATYFYKLTENYPACSWATVDYYGVPKRSHYDIQEAYQPVHVMALFEDWTTNEGKLPLTIVGVNDTSMPVSGQLEITLLDGEFNVIEAEKMEVTIPVDRALNIVEKIVTPESDIQRPLFLLLDLEGDGGRIDRNWYYFDFVEDQGSLFELPRAEITGELREENGDYVVVIRNIGQLPAISVEVHPGEASNTYYAETNAVWMQPGEEIEILLRETKAVDGQTREMTNLYLAGWNCDPVDLLEED